jgi:hypothetical protein
MIARMLAVLFIEARRPRQVRGRMKIKQCSPSVSILVGGSILMTFFLDEGGDPGNVPELQLSNCLVDT